MSLVPYLLCSAYNDAYKSPYKDALTVTVERSILVRCQFGNFMEHARQPWVWLILNVGNEISDFQGNLRKRGFSGTH